MKILGISYEHDSGVAFLDGGRLLYASNEERFNREKLTMAYPSDALKSGTEHFADFCRTADRVALASRFHVPKNISAWQEKGAVNVFFNSISILRLDKIFFGKKIGVRILISLLSTLQLPRRFAIRRFLNSFGIDAKLEVIDHHMAHASAAYYTSPWKKAMVVTLDAQGDGFCSKVFIPKNGRLQEVHAIPFFHSPGHQYLCVTLLLGFMHGREGKVTGLAGRGDPKKTIGVFEKRISFDKKRCSFINHGSYKYRELRILRKLLKGFSQEDIASGIQKHLENLVVAYIKELIRRYADGNATPLVLSGGVFANVALNKKIMQLPEVSGIYIYPHMGDGGLAAGAAMAVAAKNDDIMQTCLENMYLGPEFPEHEIEAALIEHSLNVKSAENIPEKTAKMLADGKIVAICKGRMEYGPRALGNRSILCRATDARMHGWLNARLHRSEFMPFAPILKKEHLPEFFNGWQKCEKALEYMTVALDTTAKCKKEAPAIVHVDGTARPQTVTKEIHPFIYAVLSEYERLTGRKILINTSFNMHEEPMVCTPQDAIASFRDGNLDALILGDYIIEKP